jgi:teichuronic acid biosynthesis glycosyltransferase TuaG
MKKLLGFQHTQGKADMSDLVSIITPLYNAEKTIRKTIDSVLAQSHQNWEMLIADDLSPDNSVAIVEEYIQQDSRIKLIKTDDNTGPAECRNRAIRAASGDFMAFLDSDDAWNPDKLSKQLQLMQEKDALFCYSSYELMNEEGVLTGKKVTVPASTTFTQMLKSNVIPCVTVIYNIKELGKFYMKSVGHEDYVCWLNILKSKDITAVGHTDTLAQYRIQSHSVSSNKLKVSQYQWRIYRDELKLGLITSSYYFIWYTLKGIKKHLFPS